MDKNSYMYKKAIEIANDKYGEKSSIYRSSYIVKIYKELGGIINNKLKKSLKKTGLNRWFTEEWIQVSPYLEKGQKIECGGKRVSDREGKSCRPLIRITEKTPITIPELLELHYQSSKRKRTIRGACKLEKIKNYKRKRTITKKRVN